MTTSGGSGCEKQLEMTLEIDRTGFVYSSLGQTCLVLVVVHYTAKFRALRAQCVKTSHNLSDPGVHHTVNRLEFVESGVVCVW